MKTPLDNAVSDVHFASFGRTSLKLFRDVRPKPLMAAVSEHNLTQIVFFSFIKTGVMEKLLTSSKFV